MYLAYTVTSKYFTDFRCLKNCVFTLFMPDILRQMYSHSSQWILKVLLKFCPSKLKPKSLYDQIIILRTSFQQALVGLSEVNKTLLNVLVAKHYGQCGVTVGLVYEESIVSDLEEPTAGVLKAYWRKMIEREIE